RMRDRMNQAAVVQTVFLNIAVSLVLVQIVGCKGRKEVC
ncbi:unnamed protein product, partial [Urochloa humidicola]